MGGIRIIRFEIELELSVDNTRYRKPAQRVARLAACTAEAAERAYLDSDATPALKEVRWRYSIVNRIAQGQQNRPPLEPDDETSE